MRVRHPSALEGRFRLTRGTRHLTFAVMKLTVNGDSLDVPEGLTVKDLVRHLGIDGPVAVERNTEIVPRAEHESVALTESDVIEIVHFVGGG